MHLSGRVPRVRVGGEHSGAITMHSGVPQGSIIGPLLFLLFVDDLPDVFEALTLLFVVDGETMTRRTQKINVHSSLTAALDWSKEWDRPINLTKCNYFTIGQDLTLKVPFSSISLAPPSPYPN